MFQRIIVVFISVLMVKVACTAETLPSEVEQNNLTMHFNQPANAWTEAFPIGNGKLGAMVFGV